MEKLEFFFIVPDAVVGLALALGLVLSRFVIFLAAELGLRV